LVNYLQNNVQKDVAGSKNIQQSIIKNAANENFGEKQLTEATTWNSGPRIVIVDSPGSDYKSAAGHYNSQTNTIEINSTLAEMLEKSEDKQAALTSLYATLLHETVHYGDFYPDASGSQSTGQSEDPGDKFGEEIFGGKVFDVNEDNTAIDMNKTLKVANDVINKKEVMEQQNDLPTVPKEGSGPTAPKFGKSEKPKPK
jgi:hypothetical protein